MTATLAQNSYGKSDVRVTKIIREGDTHYLKQFSVDIELNGTFDPAYIDADNSPVLPTDTMKNTVYVLAKKHALNSIEDFALYVCEHFLQQVSHIYQVEVKISEFLWSRITIDGQPHPHAFTGGQKENRTCHVISTRNSVEVWGGIDNLIVLKSTGSGFSNFLVDEYTTLQATDDRIFATSVRTEWQYTSSKADFNSVHQTARDLILKVFATHDSDSVQHTLYVMGNKILAACEDIQSIAFTMPNIHNLLVDLSPFGLDNPNEIFRPTDEPYGLIKGQVSR